MSTIVRVRFRILINNSPYKYGISTRLKPHSVTFMGVNYPGHSSLSLYRSRDRVNRGKVSLYRKCDIIFMICNFTCGGTTAQATPLTFCFKYSGLIAAAVGQLFVLKTGQKALLNFIRRLGAG
ncbi:hypothetical protein AVEN_81471-1 [Araneus ventricosus]|uniref:Uncharacterized protein n=1 Tax=Araneus ventricosus TaxID=182803 RepID=A0A4Y2E176_ARAVE|nr:hypothetical protein AVEN_81471-1 [Araneus ventricosus]